MFSLEVVHIIPIQIMRVHGVICVLFFEILSIAEAVPFKVALLVLIFKGLFVLTKVMYDQLDIARILHMHIFLHLFLSS